MLRRPLNAVPRIGRPPSRCNDSRAFASAGSGGPAVRRVWRPTGLAVRRVWRSDRSGGPPGRTSTGSMAAR